MKIVCNMQLDLVKDVGVRDDNPYKTPKEIIEEWCVKWPHLRPCKRLHGWVYKKRCVKCPQCVRVIEE